MQTAHELLILELGDMLDAERRILDSLEELKEESQLPELKKAFSSHRDQTQKQIERLEQCFEELDERAEESECKGIVGILEEKKSFAEKDPSEELKDMFNIGGASKVEHYEIAAYTGLIEMAQKMGHRSAVRLLQQNLREEQQMLKKCESLMKKFKPSQMGMEQEERKRPPARARAHRRRAA
ncbi:MAG: ferritin-like domain-containing protein [Terriglobales bacterium]